ncbi:hypothetical protein TGARI_284620 [Toxoplasma gondii ARI]|uniref:Uncharacterized protein n=1 Tax=Toxoplasma gondii ARI TaxID=1074872 RepID=A0A139XYR3_TOXGO|nr:hypothetical protein TGARI_284620 [Toxoplasma gondii ARI]
MSRRVERLRRGEGLLSFGVVHDSLAVLGPTVPGVDDPKNATPSKCSEWLTQSELQRAPVPRTSRWLPVTTSSADPFDRLRDISLKNEADEEQLIPGVKLRLKDPGKRESSCQDDEPDAWHPASPSLIWERNSTNVGTRSTANVFPFERIQATQASETRILGGYTEQLTAPFERVGATSEKFAYNACATTLPYTGLWHDEVTGISDPTLDSKQLEALQKTPASRAAEAALLRSQAAKVCPRAAKVLLEELTRDVPDAPDAEGQADLQERLFTKNKEYLSDDERVENFLLATVQPGLALGVAQKAEKQDQRNRRRGQAAAEAKAKAIASFWESRKPGSEARKRPPAPEPWQRRDALIQKEVEKSRASLSGPELAIHRRHSNKRMIIYAERFFGDLGAASEGAEADPLRLIRGNSATVAREISREGRQQANAESLIARLEMRLTGGTRGHEMGRKARATHSRISRGDSVPRQLIAERTEGQFDGRRGVLDGVGGSRRGSGQPWVLEDYLGVRRAMRLAANLERDQEREAEILGIPIVRRDKPKNTHAGAPEMGAEHQASRTPPTPSAPTKPVSVPPPTPLLSPCPSAASPAGGEKNDAASASDSKAADTGKAPPKPPPGSKPMPGPPPKKTPPPPGAGKKGPSPPKPKMKLAFQKVSTHTASIPTELPEVPSNAVSPRVENLSKASGAAVETKLSEKAKRSSESEDESEDGEADLPLPLLLPQSNEASAALSSANALDAIRRTRFPTNLRPKPVYDSIGRVILPPRRKADASGTASGRPEDCVDNDNAAGIADPSGMVSYKLVYDNPVYTGPSYEVMAEYQPELEPGAKPLGPGAETLIYEPAASRTPSSGSYGTHPVLDKKRRRQEAEGGERRRGREERSLLPRPTQFDPVTRYPHDESSRASLSLLGVNDDEWVSSGISRLANCVADLTTAPSAVGVLEMLGEQGKTGKPVAQAAVWPAMLSEEGALGQNVDTLKQVECVVDGGFPFLKLEAMPGTSAKTSRQHAGLSLWELHSSAKNNRRHELVDSFGNVRVAPFASRIFVPVRLMGKDSKFTKREEALQARYAYPEGQFSPGYYVKAADIDEKRQAILQARPPRMSVFEFQEKMRQLKLAKAREETERAERDQKEVDARLALIAEKGFQRSKGNAVAGHANKGGVDHAVAGEGTKGLPTFADLDADLLKERYRAIKKKNAHDKSLQQIKSLIAEKSGRQKCKLKVMGRHRHPKGTNKEIELERQRKKERILRMLADPHPDVNAALLLAEIKEIEKERGSESDEFNSISTQYTFDTFTVSSYETVEDAFPHYTFDYPRYDPCPETFSALQKARLNYSGVLLVSEDFRHTSAKARARLAVASTLPTGGYLHHLMYVEVRDSVVFFYSDTKFSGIAGGKTVLHAFAKGLDASQLVVDGTEDWTLLFGVCVDALTQVDVVTVEPFWSPAAELHYVAVRISGRNANFLPGAPPRDLISTATEGSSKKTKKTAEQRIAQEEEVTLFLSADTEAETLLWHRLLKRRVAFAKYASALAQETRGDRPALSIAEFCLSGVNTAVLSMKGVAFNPTLDQVLFSNLEEEKIDYLDMSCRNLGDADIADLVDILPFFVECVDLSGNQIQADDPVQVCKLMNKLHATSVDLSDNPLGQRATGGHLLGTLLTQAFLSRLDMNRCRFGAEAAKAFRENVAAIGRPVERPIAVSLSGNDLSATDVVSMVTSIKSKIPGVKSISVAGNMALTAEEFWAAVKASFHKVDVSILNFDFDQRPSPSLSTPVSGDMNQLKGLPLTLSGRLFGAGWKICGDRYTWSPAAQGGSQSPETTMGYHQRVADADGGQAVPLVYFELRGPVLIWSDVPARSVGWLCPEGQKLTSSQQRPTEPLPKDPMAASRTICAVLLYRVHVDFDAHPMVLIVEALELCESNDPNRIFPSVNLPPLDELPEQQTVSYVLRGPTDAVTLEWARILHARLAGMYYVRTEGRSLHQLSPSALRFFESGVGTILDFGGCPVSPMGLKSIFYFLCKYTWLKSLIMCNMHLSNLHLKVLSKEAWQLYDLDLLDLSFNDFTDASMELLTTVLCFRSCKRLVLDQNGFSDCENAADLVLRVGCGHEVTCLCLNGCSLGDRFAEALAIGLKTLAPNRADSCLAVVELQSNCIHAVALRNLVNALVGVLPTIESVKVSGNADVEAGKMSLPFADFKNTFQGIPARKQRVIGPRKRLIKWGARPTEVGSEGHDLLVADEARNALAHTEGSPVPDQPAGGADGSEGVMGADKAGSAEGAEMGEEDGKAEQDAGAEKAVTPEESNSDDEKSDKRGSGEGSGKSDDGERSEESDHGEGSKNNSDAERSEKSD